MNFMNPLVWVFAVLLIVLALAIFLYNRFIHLDNMVQEAWSDVNVQLKRRYSLIPNLITVVQGYMKYESKTLREIVSMRNAAIHQRTPAQKEDSENEIIKNLKHLFVVAEQYPTLKSNEQFKELSNNLVDIEDALQIARRYYNATVRDYNTAIHSFPGNLVARCVGLKDKNYFEIADFETKNIKVRIRHAK